MGNRWKKAGKQAVLLFLLVLLAVPVQASSTKEQLDSAENARKNAKGRLEEIEDKIEALEAKRNDAVTYIKEMDAELNQATANLELLEQKKTDKEKEIEITEAELDAARETEAEQYASMKIRIQYMYENGNETFLDLILGSGSIAELLNKTEYVAQITAYDREMLEVYQNTLAEIEEKEQRLLREHDELEGLVLSAEAEKEAIEILIARKAEELDRYETDIAQSEAEVEGMQAELEAFDAEIARLEEQWKRENTRVIYDGGQFLFPLNSYSSMTSDYGWRIHPIYHTQKLHNGIDFGASTGTPIMAAYSGEVTISTYSSTAGNYIMINHGGGLSTVYMHCSKLIAQVGDMVETGDVIGLVGSTGNSTGPHLHFSVRVNGEYVDPAPYIGYVR